MILRINKLQDLQIKTNVPKYIWKLFWANPVANVPAILLTLEIRPNMESSHRNLRLKMLTDIKQPEN